MFNSDLLTHLLTEATVADLKRKQKSIPKLFPSFSDRVAAVGDRGGVRLRDTDNENWYFKVHSGTESHWYEDVIHFKNIKPTLEVLVKNRKFWVKDRSKVNLTKLAFEFLKKVDIQISCTCPAAQYWGPNYILSLAKYDAKYGRKEPRSPKIRNPKKYGSMCKHLAAVMKVLPFYQTTMAKWIRDFYAADIKKWEDSAKEEYGWAKAAGTELQKRRVKVTKEKEPEEVAKEEEPKKVSAVEEEPKKVTKRKPKKVVRKFKKKEEEEPEEREVEEEKPEEIEAEEEKPEEKEVEEEEPKKRVKKSKKKEEEESE